MDTLKFTLRLLLWAATILLMCTIISLLLSGCYPQTCNGTRKPPVQKVKNNHDDWWYYNTNPEKRKMKKKRRP